LGDFGLEFEYGLRDLLRPLERSFELAELGGGGPVERFAARESAIFGQFEPAFGVIPGAGAMQHLARLMGRSRALEVMLSAQDYDADLAERYGWINRALPADQFGEFVKLLAHRVANFPAAGHIAVKDRVNAIGLAPAEEFRRDFELFAEGVRNPEFQSRIQAAMQRGFQTRDWEMDLAPRLDVSCPAVCHRHGQRRGALP